MKKSQILAALALAFALGVVAPVAGASAIIVKDVNGMKVTDEESEKKVQDAITAGKSSCGWHLVDTDNDGKGEKIFFYDQFVALNVQLKGSAENVETAEKGQYTYLVNQYNAAINTLKGVLSGATPALRLPSGVKESFPTDSYKTYSQAVTFVTNTISALKTAAVQYANTAIYAGYDAAINALSNDRYNDGTNDVDGALKAAAYQVDEAKKAAASDIEQKVRAITEGDVQSDVTYEQIVAQAKALKTTENGTCTIAKAENLEKAIKYAQLLIDSTDNFTNKDAEAAIAAIIKAQNGGTITSEDTPNNNDSTTIPGVGDTGVISAAEGTASTTVSIVAGLATALTALGAGVVAYRNARRSSEN